MNIKEKIITENIKAKKKFGQNFLIDKNILLNIINKSQIKDKNVIEIGPGLGSLTQYLILDAKKVVCYEIDPDMVSALNQQFCDTPNLIINQIDFLKISLEEEIKTYFGDEEIIVVANLPYYITTAILTKILEESTNITKIIVMVQKEVANRLSGKPSTKDYNSLSVLIQYYTNVKTLFNVSPKAFIPQPEVDSSVIMIERKKELLPLLNEEYFLKFNRSIFAQRRKTLANNLKQAFKYSQELINQVLNENNISTTIRAESLTIEQIVNIANQFYKLTH